MDKAEERQVDKDRHLMETVRPGEETEKRKETCCMRFRTQTHMDTQTNRHTKHSDTETHRYKNHRNQVIGANDVYPA